MMDSIRTRKFIETVINLLEMPTKKISPKNLLALFWALGLSFFLLPTQVQAQGSENNSNASEKKEQNFGYTRFHWHAQYYGFPMEVAIGLGYRKNDLLLFAPQVGLLMESRDYFRYTLFTGFGLAYKFFHWTSRFHYELWGVRENKKPIYFFENKFSFAIPNGKISFPTFYGKKYWVDVSSTTTNYVVENTLEQGIRLDGFLFDSGTWKATAMLAASFSWVFQNQGKASFSGYTLKGSLPITYYHTFGELAFMPSFFYGAPLGNTVVSYRLGKSYNFLTSRENFRTATNFYDFVFTQEIEYRFYLFRFWFPHNAFFLSVFSNVGVGLEKKNRSLLYQAGGGLGYTIFDSVPFTLQFGVDQDKNFIFYTGVVARVSHN